MARSYVITALGLPGAGKTVYLTMLTQMIYQGYRLAPDFMWSLEPPSSELYWDSRYRQLADPNGPWPDSTRTGTENSWTIVFKVAKGLDEFRVLEVTCNDYSGELVRPSQDIVGDDFYDQIITGSDALLVFIDGAALLSFATGSSTPRQFFDAALDRLLRPMELTSGPIHIVITKWDIFPAGFTLGQARYALENLPEWRWRQFLDARRRKLRNVPGGGSVVRLIPMSSVGGFAAVKNGDYSAFRGQYQAPAPLNVEVPIVAAIRDIGHVQVWRQYGEQRRSGSRQPAPLAFPEVQIQTSSSGTSFSYPLIALARDIIRLLVPPVRLICRSFARLARRLRFFLARWWGPSPARVRDEATALAFAVSLLERKARAFDRQNSGSILVGPGR
jgi:hypothetical protein